MISRIAVAALTCLLTVAAPRTATALAPPATAASVWNAAQMMPPGPPGQDFWQRGFQDGMMGALKDLENNRRPNPANRDEYRHPPGPYQAQNVYQQGFRRGYSAAVSKLTASDYRSWIGGPGGQIHQQGFSDGVAGAIKDFGNHRRPDPANRDQFRRPPVPPPAQNAYRDGFQRGYGWAMSQLMAGPGR